MFRFNRIIKEILKRKNEQIKKEREKLRAQECANMIMSAYFTILLCERGAVRIPKSEISRVLGSYRVHASSDGDDYVIEVKSATEKSPELLEGTCG